MATNIFKRREPNIPKSARNLAMGPALKLGQGAWKASHAQKGSAVPHRTLEGQYWRHCEQNQVKTPGDADRQLQWQGRPRLMAAIPNDLTL